MNKAVLYIKRSPGIVVLIFLLFAWTALFAADSHSALTAEKPEVQQQNHGEAHAPGMFDFDLGILVSQTINFFVLLFVLQRFLFTPISKVIDERQSHLGQIKLLAEKEHKTALEFKAEYEEHLAKIDEEIYAIKQKAVLEANQKSDEIIGEAHKKAEEIIEKGEMEVFMERQTAWARIREEVVQLTLMAAEKVVEESLDDDLHRKLINSTIERLENNLPDQQ